MVLTELIITNPFNERNKMEMLNTYRVKLVKQITEEREIDICVKTNLDINELEEKLEEHLDDVEEHIDCSYLEWSYGNFVSEYPSIKNILVVDEDITEREMLSTYDFILDREGGIVQVRNNDEDKNKKVIERIDNLKKMLSNIDIDNLKKITINKMDIK